MKKVLPLLLTVVSLTHVQGQAVTATDAAPAQPAKFKRRVLLTVFLNQHHDKDKEYLEASIPDAFSGPLVATENFVILNRKSVFRYLKEMGITPNEVYDESNAVSLGKAIGADVVLVGKFSNTGEELLIEAKAFDVQAGRLSVEAKETVQVNSNMFDAINSMAKKMSAPMAEKMKPMDTPPPPAEIVLTEEQVTQHVEQVEQKKGTWQKEYFYSLNLGFAIETPLNVTNGVFPVGFGGLVAMQARGLSRYFSKRSWLKNFEVGAMTGYLVFASENSSVQSLTQVPIYGTLGYTIPIHAVQGLTTTPFLSAGTNMGSFRSTPANVAYALPAWGAGGRIEYQFAGQWLIGYSLLGVLEVDAGTKILLLHVLSSGLRF